MTTTWNEYEQERPLVASATREYEIFEEVAERMQLALSHTTFLEGTRNWHELLGVKRQTEVRPFIATRLYKEYLTMLLEAYRRGIQFGGVQPFPSEAPQIEGNAQWSPKELVRWKFLGEAMRDPEINLVALTIHGGNADVRDPQAQVGLGLAFIIPASLRDKQNALHNKPFTAARIATVMGVGTFSPFESHQGPFFGAGENIQFGRGNITAWEQISMAAASVTRTDCGGFQMRKLNYQGPSNRRPS